MAALLSAKACGSAFWNPYIDCFVSPTTNSERLFLSLPSVKKSPANIRKIFHCCGLVSWASSTKICDKDTSICDNTHPITSGFSNNFCVYKIKSSKSNRLCSRFIARYVFAKSFAKSNKATVF